MLAKKKSEEMEKMANEKITKYFEDTKSKLFLEEKVKSLFLSEFEEKFSSILLQNSNDFLSNITLGVRLILEELYSKEAFEHKLLKEIFVKNEKSLKQEIYTGNYKVLLAAWNEYEFNASNFRNRKKEENFSLLKFYRKHCKNSDPIALHCCEPNKFGKLLAVWNEDVITHAICVECKRCYLSSSVFSYCRPCGQEYYTSTLSKGENVDIQQATWEKYHCGVIINDKMKCIKCREPFYLNLKTNTLLCLACKFESKPNSIVWLCAMCKSEFKSEAKVYNPMEFKMIKSAITQTLFLRKKARPSNVPCCNVYNYNFYHKNECRGDLFQGELNQKAIVVCEKCKSMNFYDKYIWTCPKCNKKFKQSDLKIEQSPNHMRAQSISYAPFHEGKGEVVDNNKRTCVTPVKGKAPPKTLKEILNERKNSGDISCRNSFNAHGISFSEKKLNDQPMITSEYSELKRNNSGFLIGIGKEISISNFKPTTEEVKTGNLISQFKEIKLAPGKLSLINIDDFSMLKQIGEGSYGKIYFVQHKKNLIKYGMKKIIAHSEDELAAFMQEFELVNSVQHKNIMRIFGVNTKTLDETTFAVYVLMELAKCDWDEEIRSRKESNCPYKESELLDIIKQLVSGLAHLQRNNISHRDIKPQNILVYDKGVYKLADFGEAKEVKVAKQLSTLRGTEMYMAPVLFEGCKKNLDDVTHNTYKSDIFSLGYCFLYAANLNFNIIYEIRDLKNMKDIATHLWKCLKNKYSSNLIDLILTMVNVNEQDRLDPISLEKFLKEIK